MSALRFLLLWGCLATGTWLRAQIPTITNCGETQTVCAADSIQRACFRIEIGANFDKEIDRFEIDWGDGNSQTISFADRSEDIFHDFDLRDFLGTCTKERQFTVGLLTYTTEGTEEFNASRIVFLNPPNANFDADQQLTACAGTALQFRQSACPDNVDVSFDYGDGSSGTATRHTYTLPGIYTLTQNATNACGVDTESRQITNSGGYG